MKQLTIGFLCALLSIPLIFIGIASIRYYSSDAPDPIQPLPATVSVEHVGYINEFGRQLTIVYFNGGQTAINGLVDIKSGEKINISHNTFNNSYEFKGFSK